MDHLVTVFEQLRARRPADPIVISARARMTVDDVGALAGMAESALMRSRGVPGAPIGLLAPNGPGFLAGLIALRRAGFPAVLLDPLATAQETRGAFSTMGPLPILAVGGAWPRGPADFRVTLPGPAEATAAPVVDLPAGTAVVKMTSGSTGEARGVAVTSEALLADDAALRASTGIGHQDRLVAAIPFSHSYGLSSLVLPALAHGVPLVMPVEAGPFAPMLAAQSCAGTVLHTVPAWIAALVNLAETLPLPVSLRLTISAGGPLMPQTAREFRRRYGRAVHVFYGATECGGIAYDRGGDAGERGTVGEPIEGVRVTLRPVQGIDAGEAGCVVVESPAAGLSYVPRGSAERADLEDSLGGGRFVSHDLASRDGAELRLLGRLDDVINVHGRKVRPAEVEQIIGEIEGVEGVVVHAFRADGERDPSVRAVVACAPGALTGPDVLDRCRGRLSDFKIPRTVLLVADLPRTGRGKIDRAAAAALKSMRSPAHG